MSLTESFFHYLPITDSDMRLGFYVTGGGWGVVAPGSEYPPQQHPGVYQFSWGAGRELPEFQIQFIAEGRGEFESTPTGRVSIEPNTLFLLFPGVWHRYRPVRNVGWTERWISIHGEFMHRLVESGSISPSNALIQLKSDQREALLQTFDRLLGRIHQDPTRHTSAVCANSLELLSVALEMLPKKGEKINDARSGRAAAVTDPIVNRALDIIWTRSDRPLSVNQLVASLPTTRRTIERKFMSTLGHTVLDEINQCRLLRAKRMLTETNLSIKSVAYLAGFGGQERFRRLMIAEEGCPPGEYRDRYRAGTTGKS
ncbi:AraC family transcriptional regulator [Blastopirellula sp. JC732]|uniref:AraC family transcriptional regulator n=1 Tax=Blastopirellula sediminis TaxID=2894196 RepID=A0A9X1MR97_9BACT|nr:AraC family transcriptional regulator [Blastopirellula sediminis]MCC9606124.1 AraC family transcriptional regulator [Blastopirellula sediminis]MCC9630577.1 AraC family transcriptional regulator [Blastopirellula sediminis]